MTILGENTMKIFKAFHLTSFRKYLLCRWKATKAGEGKETKEGKTKESRCERENWGKSGKQAWNCWKEQWKGREEEWQAFTLSGIWDCNTEEKFNALWCIKAFLVHFKFTKTCYWNFPLFKFIRKILVDHVEDFPSFSCETRIYFVQIFAESFVS